MVAQVLAYQVLKRGDRIPLAEDATRLSRERFTALKNKDRAGSSVKWHVPAFTVPDREPIVLHAIEGEHFADFDANMQRVFFDTVWRVGPQGWYQPPGYSLELEYNTAMPLQGNHAPD